MLRLRAEAGVGEERQGEALYSVLMARERERTNYKI